MARSSTIGSEYVVLVLTAKEAGSLVAYLDVDVPYPPGAAAGRAIQALRAALARLRSE